MNAPLKRFQFDTNLADLPWSVATQLQQSLKETGGWDQLISYLSEHLDSNTLRLNRGCSVDDVLCSLGGCGKTVKDLMCLLDELKLEQPQLVLHRKFQAVEVINDVAMKLVRKGATLSCYAIGFPYPRYQWHREGTPVVEGNGPVLKLDRLSAAAGASYHCEVTNEIADGEVWSSFYRREGKQFTSKAVSMKITLPEVTGAVSSDNEPVDDSDEESAKQGDRSSMLAFTSSPLSKSLFATDKVALIICNSEYLYLQKLATPSCDAETLAEALIHLSFKTVTLADLNLDEMKLIVKEYCSLLGTGVYAVFYFVGHGFELNGQCYLMPVDVSDHNVSCSVCMCAEEVLAMMQETNPALNLVLLDICRKSEPLTHCSDYVHVVSRVNRNTVIGYATSCDSGAYEVPGEQNGIFMKHLKNLVQCEKSVVDILTAVMQNLEKDSLANRIQFPEIRSNLSKPRSLTDPILYVGHTSTFDCRTVRWQQLHLKRLRDDSSCGKRCECTAVLNLPEYVESHCETLEPDQSDGSTLSRTLVKHLQRMKGPLKFVVLVISTRLSKVLYSQEVCFEDVLITKLYETG